MQTVLGMLAAVFCCFQPGTVAAASEQQYCFLRIETGPFVAAEHDLKYWKDGSTLERIDGADYSGTDGVVPEREIRSIVLNLAGTRYGVPTEAFSTLFNPDPDCPSGCSITCTAGVAARFDGGDGAGAYTVEWSPEVAGKPSIIRRLWQEPKPEKPMKRRFRLTVLK